MQSKLLKLISRYKSDERGTIAVMFGLLAIMLILVGGFAVDYARATHARAKISSAIDAAALAAVKGLRIQNLTDAEVETVAQKIFNENYKPSGNNSGGIYADINAVTVTIDHPNSAVTVAVDAQVKTIFAGIAGIKKIPLMKSGAAIYETKDIEVSLQLDVTGSMGGSKIADLKTATKTLVDILIPDSPTGQKVRIGFAPFAAGVNAGAYAAAVNGNVSAPDDCVYERASTSAQDSDDAPVGTAVLKTKLDLPSAMSCSNATVLPMTNNKALLKTTVDSYSTGGCTAGHLGTAWAWYLLSPKWSSIWPSSSKPAAYTNPDVRKIAVLMTDGKYNIVGGSNCSQVTTSSGFAKDTCTAMKAQGIVVYTIGFQLNDPTAIATLNDCASDPSKSFEPTTGSELNQAFADIAQDITRLRLTS